MISVLVDNPLSFWVTGTTEIRNILSLMKPCIDQLRTAGYTDCRAVVGGGVREQDMRRSSANIPHFQTWKNICATTLPLRNWI